MTTFLLKFPLWLTKVHSGFKFSQLEMSKFRCPDSHVHVKLLTLICRGRFISSSRIFPILFGRQRQRRCLESSGSQIPYCGPGVQVCRIPAEGDSHQCVIIIGLFSMLGWAFCSYCLQINLALSRIALFYPQYFNKLGEITIRCHLRLIRLCFQLLSNILYQLTALRPLSVCETLRLQHGLSV